MAHLERHPTREQKARQDERVEQDVDPVGVDERQRQAAQQHGQIGSRGTGAQELSRKPFRRARPAAEKALYGGQSQHEKTEDHLSVQVAPDQEDKGDGDDRAAAAAAVEAMQQ